ncbi:MAG: PhoH family protein [Actinobacteria bacterium]|nr:PhoH family protein [Actinomycetota bacterium]
MPSTAGGAAIPESVTAGSSAANSTMPTNTANESMMSDYAAGGSHRSSLLHYQVSVPAGTSMMSLLGAHDQLLKVIKRAFPETRIVARGNEITADGKNASKVGKLFEELVTMLEEGIELDNDEIMRTVEMVNEDIRPSTVRHTEVFRSPKGRSIRPKTTGQRRYTDAISRNVITFGIGPAGTGKSYLAVAMAVAALESGEVERIILTRPAVEAGEKLGFLPGDMMAKVDPYLRPIYDALYDMVSPEGAQRLIDRGSIEVAPLAFMRGRTLNHSFVILDEAQNTTPQQMKMFLTRIGFGSKVVVTGDITQVDVAQGRSGLIALEKILGGIDGLQFVYLTSKDVVRHYIVAQIVEAYEHSTSEIARLPDG